MVAVASSASRGNWVRALRCAVSVFGVSCLVSSLLVGVYTSLADQPDCGEVYTCRRVVDRTMLLGWTASGAAVAGTVLVVAGVLVAGPRLAVVIRAMLLAGTAVLVAGYRVTRFASLRTDLGTLMALSPSMWTASSALWLAVVGLVAAAAGSFAAARWRGAAAAVGVLSGVAVSALGVAVPIALWHLRL